jgi:hypothetical protein
VSIYNWIDDKGYEEGTQEDYEAFARKRSAVLVKYRDAGLENYIYFWTIKNIRISPIYSSEEEAKSWDGKVIELT